VVWSVFATPELSMDLRKWCFPIVGCITYRGYYDQKAADHYALGLRRDGLEAYVAGIPAYSTLGYFDDPLLNTLSTCRRRTGAADLPRTGASGGLRAQRHGVQRIICHGGGDGRRRALARAGRSPEVRASYQIYDKRRRQFRTMLLGARDQLVELYRSPLDDDAKRQGKARIFDELRQTYANLKKDEWGGYSGYDRWFEQPLTNAHLAAVATYQQWVPAFTALLAQCDGDWDRFYAAARKIGDLPPAERDAALRWRRPPPR
jgi:predicted aminopeptidase